jgi:hypothetical protein
VEISFVLVLVDTVDTVDMARLDMVDGVEVLKIHTDTAGECNQVSVVMVPDILWVDMAFHMEEDTGDIISSNFPFIS